MLASDEFEGRAPATEGEERTVQYLIEKMGLENARVVNRYDPNAAVDIAVALGNDWAAKNP